MKKRKILQWLMLVIALCVLILGSRMLSMETDTAYSKTGGGLGIAGVVSVIHEAVEEREATKSKQSFDDVPLDHWAHDEIELIYSYGITVGCSSDPPLYCPDRVPSISEEV